MQRNLNRALLATLMASTKPALESVEDGLPGDTPVDGAPAVVPAEAAASTTPEAVAAATGEAGVPETPPAAETTAPTVIIKVEVEQASKPAGASAATAAEIPPEPAAAIVPEASGTEVPPAADAAAVGGDTPAVDAAPAADAALDAAATPGVDAPAAEVVVETPAAGDTAPEASAAAPTETPAEEPAAAAAEAPVEGATEAPAEGAAEEPAAAAAEEPAPGASGEVAPEAPASGEAPTEPAAETPPEDTTVAPVDGTTEVPPVDAAAAPADAGEPAAEVPVDATPSATETDAAASEVQAAIDETKKAGEEGAEAAVSEEDLVVTGDLTPIGSEPDVIHADQIAPELEEMATELNAYQEGGDALGKIKDIVEGASEEGGLDKTAAQILEVAVEHIHQSLGLTSPIGILAMEAYDDQSTRGSATSIAMEEIAKTAKEVWESIKAGIAKFMEMVVAFYDRLASGALIQQQQAEGILKQLTALGDKKVTGTVKSAALAKALARGNSLSKNVAQDLLTTNKVLDAAWEHGGALATNITSLMSNEANSGAAKEKLVQLVQQHVAAVLKPEANLSDAGVADAPQGTTGYATQFLLGNNVLWAYVPKTVNDLGSMAFGRQAAQVEVSGDELPVLNTAEIKAIAAIVVNTAKSMAALSNMSRTLKGALASFNTFASQSANADQKPDPVLTKAIHQLAAGLASSASKLAFANNSAALSYCKSSLAKLAPETEAAPKAAAPAAAPAAA